MPAVTTTLLDAPAAPAVEDARPALAVGPVVGIALFVLAAHILVNAFSPYGFHRDEFLYLSMGRHLRLWAMDFPPAIALIARSTRGLLGDSLVAIRLLPALAHGLLIVLAGVAAREFGGRRFAQALAALSVALSPLFLRAGNLLQPVIFDQLSWTLALLALARVGRSAEATGGAGEPVAWLALGLFGGLGLLTKFSVGFIAAGMAVGLLLCPQRRVLLTRWPWAAAFLALLIGSPSIVGQIRLGFPVAEQMRYLQATQLQRVGYLDFLLQQVMMFGPIVLLPILGSVRSLTDPAARGHRAVIWSCLVAFALLLLLHGKAYYIGPIYPVLIGAGASALERWTRVLAGHAVGQGTRNGVRGVVTALVLIFGAAGAPLGLPFLAPPTMARYSAALGIAPAVQTNQGVTLRIPQDWADMLGWPQEANAVARVFRALAPAERAQAIVSGLNYGQTAALEFYGPRLGLPPAVSPAGSFWFFGPGRLPGNVVVTIGWDSVDLARYFRVVRPVARVRNPWGVPEDQDVPVSVAEQPVRPIQQLWPQWRGRN